MKKIFTLLAMLMVAYSSSFAERIPDGVYRIASAYNPTFGLEVPGGKQDLRTQIKIWTYKGEDHQKFRVTWNSSGEYYTITALHSGQAIDIVDGKIQDTQKLQQYTSNQNEAQQWVLIGNDVDSKKHTDGNKYGEIAYYICPKKNQALNLGISQGEPQDGRETLLTYWNTEAHQWLFIPVDGEQTIADGEYRIASLKNVNYNLDSQGGENANDHKQGQNVQLYEWNATGAQKWIVKYLGLGYYSIRPNMSKVEDKYLYLDLDCGKYKGTPEIHLWPHDGTSESNSWIIKDAGNGAFYVVNKNGRFMEIAGGTINNSQNIQGYRANCTEAQKWVFIPVDKNETLPNGDYRIASAINKDWGLDVSGQDVQCGKYSGSANQKWTVTHLSNGYYKIVNKGTNTELNLDLSSKKMYTQDPNVRVDGTSTPNESKWLFQSQGLGAYTIQNQMGHYLHLENGETTTGKNIKGWQQNNNINEKWVLIPINGSRTVEYQEDGIYHIQNVNSGDRRMGKNMENSTVTFYTNNEEDNQKWLLEYNKTDGYYRIKCKKDGSLLSLPYTGYIEGNKSYARTTKTDDASAQWVFRKNTDNNESWRIINALGYSLDDEDGAHDKISGWTSNSDFQRWNIKLIEVPVYITNLKYTTLYYQNLNLEVPQGVEGWAYKLSANKTSAIRCGKYKKGDIIPKDVAVVLHSNEDFTEDKKLYGFPISTSDGTKFNENMLKGSETKRTLPSLTGNRRYYRLYNGSKGVGFYMPVSWGGPNDYAGSNLNINAHRAYFIMENVVSAPEFLNFGEDDEETDIQALPEATSHKLQTTDKIYNLSGQRLQKMQRGINIVGGKKIVIM